MKAILLEQRRENLKSWEQITPYLAIREIFEKIWGIRIIFKFAYSGSSRLSYISTSKPIGVWKILRSKKAQQSLFEVQLGT